jgi:peptidyl-prolyl cis-trans isomerase A (cyclophilin A)
MIRILPLLAFALLLPACGAEAPSGSPQGPAENAAGSGANMSTLAKDAVPEPMVEPLPDKVRVRLDTEEGAIVVALDAKRAPISAANFLRYAEEKRLDGTTFYRAARAKGAEGKGFIQGGIRRNYRRMLPPIVHEPTSKTGLRHQAGTISMARSDEGAGAMGEFFIITDAMPAMDASGDKPGYAAFGRVEKGMDVVRRILAAPTIPNAGRGAMKGQMIKEPVKIVTARRVG